MRDATGTAVYLPTFLPGVLIECEQIGILLVVAQENEKIVIENRRTAVSPLVQKRGVLHAKMASPYCMSIHIEANDLSVAEPSKQMLAVGSRCWSGQIVLLMKLRKRAGCLDVIFPELAAVGSVERFDYEKNFAALWLRFPTTTT